MPMNFGLFPPIPVPPPAGEFPTGPQFQQDNVDVGPANPTNVSFNVGMAVTYDAATDTVNVDAAASGGAISGAGGGGGGGAVFIQGAFNILSAGDVLDLLAFGFTSTDEAAFLVWSKPPSANEWRPVLPSGAVANDPILATFSISGGLMSFANLTGFSEGGAILLAQLG
jgi:hypothetical protein